MMRWSFWLFVLAEFCRRCETKGTWRRVCTAESPAGSRGRAADGDQGKPHDAVGFLALGWNWFHWHSEMLQDVPLGQAYLQVRQYGGGGGGVPQYFLIGSAQISWVAPGTVWGFNPPPPVALPLFACLIVVFTMGQTCYLALEIFITLLKNLSYHLFSRNLPWTRMNSD